MRAEHAAREAYKFSHCVSKCHRGERDVAVDAKTIIIHAKDASTGRSYCSRIKASILYRLIISMFHSVPGVPRVKMERFADG